MKQAVEWGFNKIINAFAFLDYKKIINYYCRTYVHNYSTNYKFPACLFGSQTSQYFKTEPPSVEEYLNNM